MSTRIRLRRMGASKRPFYRVVVADQRSPRNGRFIEAIGKYHPLDDPSLIEIDEERALHWLRVGAQPSDQVRNLMTKIGIWEKFTSERPSAEVAPPKYQRVTKERVSKKAASKAKQEEEAASAAPAGPAAEKRTATEAPPVAEVADANEPASGEQPPSEPETPPAETSSDETSSDEPAEA